MSAHVISKHLGRTADQTAMAYEYGSRQPYLLHIIRSRFDETTRVICDNIRCPLVIPDVLEAESDRSETIRIASKGTKTDAFTLVHL